MSGNGIIKIRRKPNVAAGIRKLDVLVDGQKIGNIANNAEQSFEVPPGAHTVQVKLWSKSEIINVDLSPDSTVMLECGIAPDFWKRTLLLGAVFLAMYLGKQFAKENLVLCLALIAVIVILAVQGTRSNFRLGGTYYLRKVDDDTAIA